MLFFRTIDVADNERVLLFNRDRLQSILTPGRHWFSTFGRRLTIEKFDITKVYLDHVRLALLARYSSEILEAFIDKVELNDRQVGIIYIDNKISEILEPGSQLFMWKKGENVRVDIFDISQNIEVEQQLVGLLGRGLKLANSRQVAAGIQYIEVPDEHVGLLQINGKMERLLETGAYAFWKYNRSVTVKLIDLRVQTIDVSGQEILTKDRVSLRINLSASYAIRYPEMAIFKLKDYANFLYLELQLRLREAVGTKTLDELLEDKDALNSMIFKGVKEKLTEFGIQLTGVGVKDIILPGDMKEILNQVVEAQKEAEANVIRRREETQAMRSLHNTAKVMENNPILLRLKELEALERITTRINNISVYGGLDSILNGLVTLTPSNKSNQ